MSGLSAAVTERPTADAWHFEGAANPVFEAFDYGVVLTYLHLSYLMPF